MRQILEKVLHTLRAGEGAVLVGIVESHGSAPRTSGARMLVTQNGQFAGSIGGGPVEGESVQEALRLLQTKQGFFIKTCNLAADAAAQAGMVCGGEVTVLGLRLSSADLEFFTSLAESLRQKKSLTLLTVLPPHAAPFLRLASPEEPDADLPSGLNAAVRPFLGQGQRPQTLQVGETRVFLEPLPQESTLWLAGAGHVGLATAQVASFVGFALVVLDDRAEFANQERFPQARKIQVLPDFTGCFPALTEHDYVVIVTRGHVHDRDVLAQALRTEAGYIGMIGSRRKREAVYAALLGAGFTQKDIERVHSPIGLPIEADTPEEIAVSIVAELIAVRAKK